MVIIGFEIRGGWWRSLGGYVEVDSLRFGFGNFSERSYIWRLKYLFHY